MYTEQGTASAVRMILKMYLFTHMGRNILPMFPLDEVILVQWYYVDLDYYSLPQAGGSDSSSMKGSVL